MHIIGRVVALKGAADNEYMNDKGVAIEVTEVSKDGLVEVAFDMPGRLRVYVAVKLQDLVASVFAHAIDE